MSERWFGISIKAIPQLQSTCSGFDVDVMKCLTEFYSHTIEESSSPVHFLVTCFGAKKTKTLRGKTALDFVWRHMHVKLEARQFSNMKTIHEFFPLPFCLSQKDTAVWQDILNLSVAGATARCHIRMILSVGHLPLNLCPFATPSSSSNYNVDGLCCFCQALQHECESQGESSVAIQN